MERKKILIVDDDLALLETLQEILRLHGYNCKSCHQTEEVLGLVERYKPDLIILDYLLPEWNGGEICSAIRGINGFGNTPIIIMSAYSNILLSLAEYGCDVVLEKPFGMDEFLKSVSTLLASKSEDSGLLKKIRTAFSNRKNIARQSAGFGNAYSYIFFLSSILFCTLHK